MKIQTAEDRLEWLQAQCGNNYPELQQILLQYGGNAVVIYAEEDEKKIRLRGQLFRGGPDVILKPGVQSQCHMNAALLRERYPSYRVCTGYALSKDASDGLELWRQHSWCLNSRGQVVETTTLRSWYFGFVLTSAEAEDFYVNNAL